MVGRVGLEPTTFCASETILGLNLGASVETNSNLEKSLNWEDFKDWVYKKYSKTYAPNVVGYARKYHGMLGGNFRELDAFSKAKKNGVLRALISLSKYLGVYEQFRAKIKNYGVKWEGPNSLQAFLRIAKNKEDLIPWIKTCMEKLDRNYAAFIKFMLISGLRKGEAIKSWNLIIKLNRKGALKEYYNEDLESLEHFKYESLFIRGSKNVFFSFIPKFFTQEITQCSPVSQSTIRRRINKLGLKLRINELRDYHATFMIHHGLIREEVDLLQGRIGKSIFMRHYFSPAIKNLKERALNAIAALETP